MRRNRKTSSGCPDSGINFLPVAVEVLLSCGINRGTAVPCAERIYGGFVEKFGGRMLYIRKKDEGNEAFWLVIEQVVADVLAPCGIPHHQAAMVGRKIAVAFCEANIGRNLYISNGFRQQAANKRAIIYAEYDGSNIKELITKYQLSSQRLYQIIAQVRAELRDNQKEDDPSGPGLLDSVRRLPPEAACEALTEIAALMDSGEGLREIRPKFKRKVEELLSIQEKDEQNL